MAGHGSEENAAMRAVTSRLHGNLLTCMKQHKGCDPYAALGPGRQVPDDAQNESLQTIITTVFLPDA